MAMSVSENANLNEGLRKIGFTSSQIADLQLMVSGWITINEWIKRYENGCKEKNESVS